MNYTAKLFDLAREHMTSNGFFMLMDIEKEMPEIWDRPTSSTGKYHLKANGSVPSCSHHTYEMLVAGIKSGHRLFGHEQKSTENDVYIMCIFLHDMMKYGVNGDRDHTDNNHEILMSDYLWVNKRKILEHLGHDQFNMLYMGVRYHAGRWSRSVPNRDEFDFSDYPPIVMFMAILDMFSTVGVLAD